MPAIHVERSVRIAAPVSRVRPAVEDFHQWPRWSPWLCMEPNAKVSVYGAPGSADHGFAWDGELVGTGSIKMVSIADGRQTMELSFRRPFRSTATSRFELKPVGQETDVVWHMDSKLPFFLFFMVDMMKTMIGMDYERGLTMLKEFVEAGEVKARTDVVGLVEVPPWHYVGVEASCSLDDMGPSMEQSLPAAHAIVTDHKIEMSGPPGALYHAFDMKRRQCRYTAFMPTVSRPSIAGVPSGSPAACRAIKVVHTGSYRHLANGWSAAMAYQRAKKFRPLKSHAPFEVYISDPRETAEAELVTEIYIPVRG
jgi:hypothetical protein